MGLGLCWPTSPGATWPIFPKLAAAVLEGESLDLCQRLEAKGIPFVLYTSYDQSERQFTRATIVEKPAPLTDVVAAWSNYFPFPDLRKSAPE
jgi:hypothetical protein